MTLAEVLNTNAFLKLLHCGNQFHVRLIVLVGHTWLFQVNETAVVNCGFYSERGGFEISDEDKSYMRTCKAVVSTCAFGGGDDLHQPIGMTEASLRKVNFRIKNTYLF